MLLLLIACHPDEDDSKAPEPESCLLGSTAYDAAADAVPCNAEGPADLLESTLADAGLDRDDFGVTPGDWNKLGYGKDDFLLSWFLDTHHDPESVPCFTNQLDADVDAGAASAHPVASTIAAFAAHVDVTLDGAPVAAGSLEEALTQLQAVAGGTDDPARASELPEGLQGALAPILLAIADGVSTRAQMDVEVDEAGFENLKPMFNGAAGLVLPSTNYVPDIANADELAWWTDWYLSSTTGPRSLVQPARNLAFAVEDVDWACAAADVAWTFTTDLGDIVITGTGADTHDGTQRTLLVLDLGGDDTWVDGAGATLDEENPVSLAIDLGGHDTYTYTVVPDDHDTDGLLPSDADGRDLVSGYYVSNSRVGRQGSGRYGIGMLFDLGADDDSYTSLRMSQGFGANGVGVLYDGGGNDTYTGEAGVQGAGIWGLGIVMDAGAGADQYRTWTFSQGFAYVGAGGLAWDGGGDDVWWSDPGNNFGGTTLYASAQLAGGEGNNSFTQGAGFGMRADSYGFWLSGGLGMLRDLGGNDAYTAGVFAQATGYCKGTGVLADAAGDDTYNALWYVQAGAAHDALAILAEGGGNDRYNPDFTPYNVHLGSGHDMSVGVFMDEGGDDWYHATTLALGASNCQGIGVFADNDGSDEYQTDSTYSVGLGNHSGECDDSTGRTTIPSIGIFMDAGGDADVYHWPADETRTPADNSSFGIAYNGGADEFGGAVDGDGESNFHAR